MRSFSIPKCHYSDQIKETKFGGVCGTHGGEEKCEQGFGGEARRKQITRKTKA
jgi:hypothetical protein